MMVKILDAIVAGLAMSSTFMSMMLASWAICKMSYTGKGLT